MSSDFQTATIKMLYYTKMFTETAWSDPPIKKDKLECGPMPNVMVALPNIGGAFCSTPQSLADAH